MDKTNRMNEEYEAIKVIIDYVNDGNEVVIPIVADGASDVDDDGAVISGCIEPVSHLIEVP